MRPVQSDNAASTRTIRLVGWGLLIALFLVPVVATQISSEIQWTALDFGVFGALLAAFGLGCDLAVRRLTRWSARFAWALTLGTAALLVLVNGAVGLIGSEGADANGLFGIVLAVLAVGIAISRADAQRMAQVLVAAAVTQLAVVGVVIDGDMVPAAEQTSRDALFAGPAFALLWLMAAYLFRRAAR